MKHERPDQQRQGDIEKTQAEQGEENLVRYRDRRAAGAVLAESLGAYLGPQTLVLGIPRGGVMVAAAVAEELGATLDLIVAQKLNIAQTSGVTVGAVTADGSFILNDALLQELQVDPRDLDLILKKASAAAHRREQAYRRGLLPRQFAHRVVILVDDGLITGSTLRAAVSAIRKHRPARLIVAVPVGAAAGCAALRAEVDELICAESVEPFGGLGLYYYDFKPVSDSDVQAIIEGIRGTAGAPPKVSVKG
jgi:predicted phosphoribosyltransferase